MTYKLKPCPFCGSKADVFKHEFHWLPTSFGIICSGCMAQTFQFYDKQEDAIKVWNKRME